MPIWQIEQLRLELKYTWKISRNASTYKINSLISVSQGDWKGMGEAAPNIRYGETPELLLSEFERFLAAGAASVNDLADLEALLFSLKLPNALRFGIESAFLHMLCHAESTDIGSLLGITLPGKVPTSFSLPIMDPGEIATFYEQNNLSRFGRIKVKVNAENARDLLKSVNAVANQPLIVDGNEAWTDPDDLLKAMEDLKSYRISLMEQPLPAGMVDAYSYVKTNSPFLLFADESICAEVDFESIQKQFHGINMKLMKAGGYLNGLRLLHDARKLGLQTMVGCMVETSLGILSALNVCAGVTFADLDGFLIVSNEPFGLVQEGDGVLYPPTR